MKSTHPRPFPPSQPLSKPRQLFTLPEETEEDAALEDGPTVEYPSTVYFPLDSEEVEQPTDIDKEDNDENDITCQYEIFSKELGKYLATRRAVLEEKMSKLFYNLRIEQAKRFIKLTENINKKWDDLFDYLKAIASSRASGDGNSTVHSITNSDSLTAPSQLPND